MFRTYRLMRCKFTDNPIRFRNAIQNNPEVSYEILQRLKLSRLPAPGSTVKIQTKHPEAIEDKRAEERSPNIQITIQGCRGHWGSKLALRNYMTRIYIQHYSRNYNREAYNFDCEKIVHQPRDVLIGKVKLRGLPHNFDWIAALENAHPQRTPYYMADLILGLDYKYETVHPKDENLLSLKDLPTL